VKKKTVVKIILDVVMIAAIALMYSKQALGMAFHEIGGLILIGVFFIHKGLNFEWIRRVTVKLSKADGRTRFMWIVDALMLLSFLTVGVTGILISKVAFPGLTVQGGPWKSLHYGCAALSLILVGVHMGLHYNYLKGIFSRWVRLPRVAAVALALVLVAYGAYGVGTTSFVRWLSMPFSTSAQGGEGFHGNPSAFPSGDSSQSTTDDASAQTGDSASVQTDNTSSSQTDGAFVTLSDTTSSETVGTASSQTDDAITALSDTASAQAVDAASSQTSGTSGTGSGQFGGQGFGDRGGQSGSLGSALSTLLQFFSIAFLFAALTALVDQALRRKKRQAAA
jgi:hypothetical protein